MLYVTTRNERDAVTAQKAIIENRSSDGGFYVPFRMPAFSQKEIEQLKEKSFGQTAAEILNHLFQTNLTSWDIDFSIGRYPIRLENLGYRTIIAETWHNPEWSYDRLVRNLTSVLCPKEQEPTDWMKIAIRIAVLFGIYGELMRLGIDAADIVVVTGDFSAPASAWYARQWGLPIGNIVCCCNENHQFWDLICHGQMRTDVLCTQTGMRDMDISLPDDLERLIYACGGVDETARYLDVCRKGSVYLPGEAVLKNLRRGLHVSVVSSERIRNTIPNVYQTHEYVLSSYASLAYAGLMDYRCRSGITRDAVVLAEKSPAADIVAVATALELSEEVVRKKLL